MIHARSIACRCAPAALFLAICLLGCDLGDGTSERGGSGPGAANQVATVPASAWVRNTTDIESYRIDNGEQDAVALTLLDAAGNALATLSVQPLPGRANPDGTEDALQGVLSIGGETALTLFTHGVALQDGYATKIELNAATGESVRLRAEHRYQTCFDPAPPPAATAAAPACAAPLSLEPDAYALPACGLPRYTLEENGLAPQLTSLRYIQNNPLGPTNNGARRFDSNGNVLQASLGVFADGQITDTATVAAWLAATGAGAIIGSPAERLLSAAFQDPAWRDFVEDQLAAEAAPIVERRANFSARLFSGGCPLFAGRRAGAPPRAAQCAGFDWLSDLLGNLADAQGDPHLSTYDSNAYDFQGAGEFIVATSIAGPNLEVQVRLEPLPSPDLSAGAVCANVTYVSAVAFGTGGSRVGLYAREMPALRVDGAGVADASALAAALPAGVTLEERGDEYAFNLADGTEIVVKRAGITFAVSLRLPDSRRGQVRGLFGTFNGDRMDDFSRPDGSLSGYPASFSQLYDDFGESWRVPAGQSLFDYAPGSGPADFTIANFPTAPARVSGLTDAARAAAEAACAEVEGEPLFTWCVLDTACTGAGDTFARLYAGQPLPAASMAPAPRPVIVSGELVERQPDSVAANDSFATTSCRIPAPTGNVIFAEARGLSLAAPVTVDIDQPGRYDDPADLMATTLPVGTAVDVFFIHVPQQMRVTNSFATARFAGAIVGVALTPTSLNDSDDFGGALTYPGADPGRGLELGIDTVTVSPDGQTLRLNLGAMADVDQLRVFVAAN